MIVFLCRRRHLSRSVCLAVLLTQLVQKMLRFKSYTAIAIINCCLSGRGTALIIALSICLRRSHAQHGGSLGQQRLLRHIWLQLEAANAVGALAIGRWRGQVVQPEELCPRHRNRLGWRYRRRRQWFQLRLRRLTSSWRLKLRQIGQRRLGGLLLLFRRLLREQLLCMWSVRSL